MASYHKLKQASSKSRVLYDISLIFLLQTWGGLIRVHLPHIEFVSTFDIREVWWGWDWFDLELEYNSPQCALEARKYWIPCV